jgi:Family of unknown function (DUF6086)
VSLNFEHDGMVVWHPGMLSGQIFLAQVRALESLAGRGCGISEIIKGDTYGIDAQELREYSMELLDWYFSTSNPVPKSMLSGLLKICAVLAERAGAPVEILPEGARVQTLQERHAFKVELEAQRSLM